MAAPWTLLYADDVMLACEDKTELERQAQAWCDRLALFGLKLNVKKTEYLTTDVDEYGSIKISGTELSRVTSFKYLGSPITSDGSLKLEVNAHCNGEEMLRWTAGDTRLDRSCAKLSSCLRRYGHVLRANDDTVRKIGLNLEVPGKRPRGRPKQRWLDTLRLDLKMAGVHPDEAFDRENWRHHTRRADPATKRNKR
ncbi:unnamed protein product [Heligmosomoides polygyrus]|uniref:Reverse transcriptase domain-containing protein n=1 Tax=Heligmosomoides polygyrus TaxID=6339 RepID=A0A3P8EAB0_HELPZ|nr:unnamed protein product [Heligmosomoides polygyrus]